MAQRILRPLSYGDLFDEMFDLYKKHFMLFVGIAGILYIPLCTLIYALASAQTAQAIVTFLLMPIQYIVLAATTWAVSRVYLGESATIKESYSAIRSKWLGLFGTMLLAGVFIFLGFMALIVPGVILAFRYSFLSEVYVLENLHGKACRVRSAGLVKGNINRIFVVNLCIGLLAFIVTFALTMPIEMLTGFSAATQGAAPNPVGGVLYGFAQALATSLTAPLSVIACILLYYDIRVRKEGFDIQMLAQNMGKASATPDVEPTAVN